MRLFALVLLAGFISCSSSDDNETSAGTNTGALQNVCGDGAQGGDEACDTAGDSATCNDDCTTPVCGDGHVNHQFIAAGATSAEQCDDGNTTAGDGCSATCQVETCGNGVSEAREQCDDGNSDDLDGCRNDCTSPRCGDAVASTGETCDTGADSATCNADCAVPSCGDGHVNDQFTPPSASAPERCDDGNSTSGDGCSATCQLENCGNGVVDGYEDCDDGNSNDLDGCRNNCALPRCGDGVVSTSETCDTGANTATCNVDCTTPTCGDGIVNTAAGEQCDDGNTAINDGCNQCVLETSFLQSSSGLNFGTVFTNAVSDIVTATITNTSESLSTSALGVTTVSDPHFIIEDSTCTVGTVLSPLASCAIQLRFVPDADGVVTATLSVGADTGGEVVVELAAEGRFPSLFVTPNPFDFGTFSRSTGHANVTFLVTNGSDVTVGAPDGTTYARNCNFGSVVLTTTASTPILPPSGVSTIAATLTSAPGEVGEMMCTMAIAANGGGATILVLRANITP